MVVKTVRAVNWEGWGKWDWMSWMCYTSRKDCVCRKKREKCASLIGWCHP